MSSSQNLSFRQIAALFLIHLLTASGAPIALMAALAGLRDDWAALFAWLGLALIVDGIDGPLARRFDIARQLPRWSGSALDFVIDYVTYVFLPAFALAASPLLSAPWDWICGGMIAFTGALYFADSGMKTPDGAFKGFPAVWNMAIFVLIVLQPAPNVIIGTVLLFSVLTFVPIKFVHPVRVKRWRLVTLGVTALWLLSATLAIIGGLTLSGWWQLLLAGTSLYLLCVSAVQQAVDRLR